MYLQLIHDFQREPHPHPYGKEEQGEMGSPKATSNLEQSFFQKPTPVIVAQDSLAEENITPEWLLTISKEMHILDFSKQVTGDILYMQESCIHFSTSI